MVSDVQQSASDLKSSATDAVDKVKETARKAADATPLTDVSGKGSMRLDKPVDFSASFIRLIPLDGKAVLQIKSHKDTDTESPPMFLIQGETDAASLAALNGKSVPCQVFAQVGSESDKIWSNLDGDPVNVTVQVNGDQITAKFDSTRMSNTKTEQTVSASGTFNCVLYQ